MNSLRSFFCLLAFSGAMLSGQDLSGVALSSARDGAGVIRSQGMIFGAWIDAMGIGPKNFSYMAIRQGGSGQTTTGGAGRLLIDQKGWSVALLGDAGAALSSFAKGPVTNGAFQGGFVVVSQLPNNFTHILGLPDGVGIMESLMVTKINGTPRTLEFIIGLTWRKGPK